MLDDRPYMRQSECQPAWAAWARLMAVIVGVFVLQVVTALATGRGERNLFDFLELNSFAPFYYWPLQLFTFQFLHSTSNLLHILFNCLMLYFLGSALEERLGSRVFLKLYLACGVGGGVLQLVMGLLFPQHFGGATVGASAGIMGLLSAFALLNWEQRMTVLLFFILPITIVAKYLILAAFLMSGLSILIAFNQPPGQQGGGIAHGAHLGGLIMGLVYVKLFVFSRISLDWSKVKPARPTRRELVRSRRATTRSWSKPQTPEPEEELPPSEFISREVDPILDKISAHGIHSLTERERKILEAARNRMGGKQ